MRSMRLSLYAQFLLWAGLNLALVGTCLYAYAPHGEAGLNLFLTQSVRERLTAIAREVADDLYQVEPSQWGAVLARRRDVPGVLFSARIIARAPPPRDNGGEQDRGPPGPPPEEGTAADPGAHVFRRDRGPPPGAEGHGPDGPGFPPRSIDIRHASAGTGFDVAIPVDGVWHGGPPHDFLVTARAASFVALLRLFGIGREILFGVILLSLSALLWWPWVWRITRTVRNLSHATQLMSRGRLDTRVLETRRDELGDLAAAVNAMAARLEAILGGQRQFVADVAHEVISPVARMQIGLGILDGRLGESDKTALNDVREDLEQMAVMLNELLLFSRTSVEAGRSVPVAVELRPLIEKIVLSEADAGRVVIEVPERLTVQVPAAMLARALANLIRNACRYGASSETPVEMAAWIDADRVRISVRDRGPGVLESSLARLGEPFFRPELARTRATGGFGLGLAIVRRCIAACDGEVTFHNRSGGGFEARIDLPLNSDA
jgi:two-component system sensor histidine kinase CpxA